MTQNQYPFHRQQVSDVPQNQYPFPRQQVSDVPQNQYSFPRQVTHLPQFQDKPQEPEFPPNQPNRTSVVEKEIEQSSVEELKLTKKKRARSLGLESSPSVEILNDDELENELKNELGELEE